MRIFNLKDRLKIKNLNMEKRQFTISEEVLNQVFGVLANLPYHQVVEVIDKLKADIKPLKETGHTEA